jgi:hypothetical protein
MSKIRIQQKFNPTPHGSLGERHPTACWADWPNNDDDFRSNQLAAEGVKGGK